MKLGPIILATEISGGWVAEFRDCPVIHGFGATPQAALQDLARAYRSRWPLGKQLAGYPGLEGDNVAAG